VKTQPDGFESEAQGETHGNNTAEETHERDAKNTNANNSQFDLVMAMGQRVLGERTKVRA